MQIHVMELSSITCSILWSRHAAMFVESSAKNPTTSEVWNTFLKALCTVLMGFPVWKNIWKFQIWKFQIFFKLTACRGTYLSSREFLFLASGNGITPELSSIESHHSAGVVERIHHPLRLGAPEAPGAMVGRACRSFE